RRGCWAEEQLPVKDLRKIFVQVDAIVFTAEPDQMLSIGPACGVEKDEIILQLRNVGSRRWSNLKAGAVQREFVNQVVNIVIRPLDIELICCNDRGVDVAIVDTHVSETEFIHPPRRKRVRFGDVQE